MQDRYAGDIGDFGKFSLLRTLFSSPQYRLGVVWYLYPDESHNDDGRHIEYLDKAEYKVCDDDLVNCLLPIVNGERSVKVLENSNLLPSDTIYYSKPLTFHLDHPGQKAVDKQARKDARDNWLVDAVNAVSNCNVVFLDPDNGLEIKSIPGINQKLSGKFAYYSEVNSFFKTNDVCIIYHHLNRTCKHDEQIKQRAEEVSNFVSEGDVVFAIRYKPYIPRAYFILTAQAEVESMRRTLHEFMDSPCGHGWDSYYER